MHQSEPQISLHDEHVVDWMWATSDWVDDQYPAHNEVPISPRFDILEAFYAGQEALNLSDAHVWARNDHRWQKALDEEPWLQEPECFVYPDQEDCQIPSF